jgi:hypothetical protein
MKRRRFVLLGLAASVLVGLAGCDDDDGLVQNDT